VAQKGNYASGLNARVPAVKAPSRLFVRSQAGSLSVDADRGTWETRFVGCRASFDPWRENFFLPQRQSAAGFAAPQGATAALALLILNCTYVQ
jgi:hypothetical protein